MCYRTRSFSKRSDKALLRAEATEGHVAPAVVIEPQIARKPVNAPLDLNGEYAAVGSSTESCRTITYSHKSWNNKGISSVKHESFVNIEVRRSSNCLDQIAFQFKQDWRQ